MRDAFWNSEGASRENTKSSSMKKVSGGMKREKGRRGDERKALEHKFFLDCQNLHLQG